jgi:Lrp/AsnC family transcriptional regulator for asnA, asnC and gidA
MTLDPIDASIVKLLGQDGRMSNREVARLLDVSEGMVRQRRKKLVDGKAIRLGMVTDLAAAGFLATVIVRLKTEPARAREVATALAELECCTFVSLTLGRFDLMAVLIARNREEIAQLLDRHVNLAPGIISIDIVEPVKASKHRYDLVHLG